MISSYFPLKHGWSFFCWQCDHKIGWFQVFFLLKVKWKKNMVMILLLKRFCGDDTHISRGYNQNAGTWTCSTQCISQLFSSDVEQSLVASIRLSVGWAVWSPNCLCMAHVWPSPLNLSSHLLSPLIQVCNWNVQHFHGIVLPLSPRSSVQIQCTEHRGMLPVRHLPSIQPFHPSPPN